MVTISPTESQFFEALRTFLVGILASDCDVVQAQDNRVPEPKADNFVIMTPRDMARLKTNEDSFTDAVFVGSIAGAVMTITEVEDGALAAGSVILGVDVVADTTVVEQLSGTPGGLGTYSVDKSQSIASRVLAAGHGDYLQASDFLVQLDVHGPQSAGNYQKITTLFRDEYAVDRIHAVNPMVTPLYADGRGQMPFINDQNQYETRWVIEAHLQVNWTVTVQGQPFFDAADVEIINVDAEYPPA